MPASGARLGKLFSGLLLILILASLVAGCGGSTGGEQTGGPVASPASSSLSSASNSVSPALTGNLPPAPGSSSVVSLSPSASSGGGKNLTVISALQGSVTVLKSAASGWINGAIGMLLAKEDSLKTEAAANATVTFFDGSTIEIQESSLVKIVDLQVDQASGSTTMLLHQEIGQTVSRVKKLVDANSRYEIETPVAVAAVRGTTMQVSVAPDGSTTVANIEGTVSVTAQGKEVMVPPGQHSYIGRGQVPGPPQAGLIRTIFDQQRATVINYLQSWFRADGPISDVVGSIVMPAQLNGGTQTEITNNLNSALAALRAGIPNVRALTPPDIDLAKAHWQASIKLNDDQLANVLGFQKAVADGSSAEYAQALDQLGIIEQQVNDFNQMADDLMAHFGILEGDIPG
jgi:hypothetical protein